MSRGKFHKTHNPAHASPAASAFSFRLVLIVLVAGWIARFLFVQLMPWEVWSADFRLWDDAMNLLEQGRNPYKETTILNWPPLWMQLIYLIAKTSAVLHIPFLEGVRIFLAVVESLVVIALFRLIRLISPGAHPFKLILLGIALNPTTIFLTCQQGNFDVIVALWVILFTTQLVQYYQSQDDLDWLAACFFLGLGILTKTVPLVLCPMLVGGLRRAEWKSKWMGVALVFVPVTLGMSIIYVLAPAGVATNVLGYRSTLGWFGISGLLDLAGASRWMELSAKLFYLMLAAGGAMAAFVFWKRERMEPREIVLCAAMFLAVIPGIGPGYSPQYLYWSLPLLIASCLLYGGLWRWTVVAFVIVAAVTCIVEYGLLPAHGMYVYFILKNSHAGIPVNVADYLDWWACRRGEILMRLPLFFAFLALLTTGIRLLIRKVPAETHVEEPSLQRA